MRKTKNPAQLGPHEFTMSYCGQRGYVVLRHPDDMDLAQEIGAGRLTIKLAREIVAERRRQEQSS